MLLLIDMDFSKIFGLLNEVVVKFMEVCLEIIGKVFCIFGIMFVVILLLLVYFKKYGMLCK